MAASSSPIESILYDYVAWIKAGIAAYLAAITSAMADSLVLTTPINYEVSDADPWGQPRYPVVLVYPDEAPIESDIDSGHDEVQVSASCMIAISDGSPVYGTKRILRYMEAVREMIRDDRSMGNKVDMISTRGIAYTPVDPEQPAIRIATISVVIRKILDRY